MVAHAGLGLTDINYIAKFPHIWDRCLAQAIVSLQGRILSKDRLFAEAVVFYGMDECVDVPQMLDEIRARSVIWSRTIQMQCLELALERLEHRGLVRSVALTAHRNGTVMITMADGFYDYLSGS